MRNLRTLPRNLPPGRVALAAVVAGAIAPWIWKKTRPLAKSVGKGMVKFGKKIRDAAEEPHDPAKVERIERERAEVEREEAS
jgi:hypothetical protein